MTNWIDMTRKVTARMLHHMAVARSVRHMAPEMAAQPVALIPGMPEAPEACCLPEHYEEARHPRHALVELKVNGIRGVATPGRIVTREALPLNCALHCRPGLDRLEAAYGELMVFDGEYQEEEGFEATLSAFKLGNGAGVFWLFDAVPYREWKVNRFTQTLEERKARLLELVGAADSPFVGALDSFALNAEDTQAKARELWAEGYEGVVVKDAKSFYSRKRSFDWMKLKQRHTLDLVIKDVLVKDGRAVSLLCDWNGRTQRIGAGIPESVREHIANLPEHYTGQLVEVGYNDISNKGALLGGHFIRLRHDRPQRSNHA